jgi:hypothetical protein
MGPNARSILFYGSSAPSEPLDSLACVEVLFFEFCPSLPRENHLSGGRMQLFILASQHMFLGGPAICNNLESVLWDGLSYLHSC